MTQTLPVAQHANLHFVTPQLAIGGDRAIGAIRAARPHANVWYAADALTWHHARTGTDAATAAAQRTALGAWREQNPLDVVRIIREQRARGL